jgi:hypothetical protein
VSNNLGECEAEEDDIGKETKMEGEGGGYGGRHEDLKIDWNMQVDNT